MNEKELQKRIGYEGEIQPILSDICSDYALGSYLSHQTLTFGYEDFNIILTTSEGKFFVKIFAASRDLADCQRYISVLEEVVKAGVRHPKLLKIGDGHLFQKTVNGADLRLCVMDYIDGKNLYETKSKLTEKEMTDIVRQATKINHLKIKPAFVYDSWAITSFPREFEKRKTLSARKTYD